MRQKTLKVYIDPYCGNEFYEPLNKTVSVGEKVMLIEKYNELTGKSNFTVNKSQDGISGNMNSDIKKYHGWRGTFNDVATYAHGLREVVKVGNLEEDNEGYYYQKITVGKDLKPNDE